MVELTNGRWVNPACVTYIERQWGGDATTIHLSTGEKLSVGWPVEKVVARLHGDA